MPAPLDFTNPTQYLAILPEVALLTLGSLLLLIEMIWPRRKGLCAWVTALGLIGALVAMAAPWHVAHVLPGGHIPFLLGSGGRPLAADLQTRALGFFGNVATDGFGLMMRGVILLSALLVALMSARYAERFRNPGEFFALIVFATLAAMLLCVAADMVLIYLTIEFLSITSYVLVGYLKFQPRSVEAAIKYFLYGAIAAAVMLYGMTFLYGATGTTNLYATPTRMASGPDGRPQALYLAVLDQPGLMPGTRMMLTVATILILVGFGFKAAAVPFHQWVPDVYDAAPTPVMAWLSVASKTAGVAVLLRFFTAILPADIWLPIVILVSALTMTVGNLVALAQTNIKRMLAYSSIAQAGYMLMGFAALGSGSGTGLWQVYSVPIYLATYVFMNLGVIAVVVAVYENRRSHQIADYAGLARSAPGLAWLMVFFLLSLAGIPPTAGFFGKLGLFYAAIENRLYWLAILAFIMSVISVYYYFGVIKAMFFTTEGEMQPVRSGFGVKAALAISLIGTLGIFLFAQPFLAIVGTMQP